MTMWGFSGEWAVIDEWIEFAIDLLPKPLRIGCYAVIGLVIAVVLIGWLMEQW